LTPFQLDDPRLGVTQNAALEPGPGAEAGRTVDIAEAGLGFHVQDPTALKANVSSFQRTCADGKTVRFHAQKTEKTLKTV
jgi:hypothetical protein